MNKYLYDELAKRWFRGGSIWLFSDPHFNDEESHLFRGEDYPGDDEVVRRINSKVGKNDTIIFLGDIGDIEYIKKIKGYKVLLLGNHDKGASNYKREYEEQFDHTSQYKDNPEDFNKMKKDGWVIEDEHFTEYCGDSYAIIDAVLWKKVKDNHLFDEVYEGPLMINDRIILSHERIDVPEYMFNIHGHTHSLSYQYDIVVHPYNLEHIEMLLSQGYDAETEIDEEGNKQIVLKKPDNNHINVCAEAIGYEPVNLGSLIKQGLLKDVPNIHRITIDKAIERKLEKDCILD